ncbi:hypothetical protein ABID96_001855 [Bacillus sp. OAE603]
MSRQAIFILHSTNSKLKRDEEIIFETTLVNNATNNLMT